MSIKRRANEIYSAIKDDADACAQIRKEFSSLALQIATDPSASQVITSATVNGQTFSAAVGMTNGDRMTLLRYVVWCLDNQTPLSSVQITTF